MIIVIVWIWLVEWGGSLGVLGIVFGDLVVKSMTDSGFEYCFWVVRGRGIINFQYNGNSLKLMLFKSAEIFALFLAKINSNDSAITSDN